MQYSALQIIVGELATRLDEHFNIFSLFYSSREWDLVDKAEKNRILQNSLEDGEFWWVSKWDSDGDWTRQKHYRIKFVGP